MNNIYFHFYDKIDEDLNNEYSRNSKTSYKFDN